MEINGKIYKEPFELTPEDLKVNPVWEYRSGDDDENISDTIVCPVEDLPVSSLDGRIVGTEATLANGSTVWVILANVMLDDPRYNEHFITLSVLSGSKIFHLGRYFDPWYGRDNPSTLAAFLGLAISEVFPITYDISVICMGAAGSVKGSFLQEPRERLSEAELMRRALK